ncbi:MAG: hypothetical protein ABSC73_08755 [Acidimicrobiales bacterium]
MGSGYARSSAGARARVDLAVVWGRDADKAAALGEEFGIDAYADFTEFLSRIDVVVSSPCRRKSKLNSGP